MRTQICHAIALTWRVLCGLNERIEISSLVVGHTKFASDWCFSLLKQKFRKTLVGCQEGLLCEVNQSTTTNVSQLVGKEDGTTIVQQYDWASVGFSRLWCSKGSPSGRKLKLAPPPVFCWKALITKLGVTQLLYSTRLHNMFYKLILFSLNLFSEVWQG